MTIFKPKYIPIKAQRRASWDLLTGWAIEIDDQIYYGARTKEQLEKALEPQSHQPINKNIYYVDLSAAREHNSQVDAAGR